MKKIIIVIVIVLLIGIVNLFAVVSVFKKISNEVENPKVVYTDDYKKVYSEGFNDGVSQSFCLHLEEGAAYSHSEPPYFTWDDCVTPEEAAESGFSYTLGSMPIP